MNSQKFSTKQKQILKLIRNDLKKLMSYNWFESKLINITQWHALLRCCKILSFHILVCLNYIGTVLKCIIKPTNIHVFCVVMYKDFLFINLHEPLSKPIKNVTCACIVRQSQHTVIHIERCLVAVANFEPFFVPMNHIELFS